MITMKAVRIHRFGGLEVLEEDTVDRPVPAAGEVLVRLAGTSVNPVDYKTREGRFPVVGADRLPYTLGRDAAGWVRVLGDGVTGLAPGDRVYANCPIDRGAYAEYVSLPAGLVAMAPKRVDLAGAAAVPLAALTAWQGLMIHAGLKSGQRVLVHGGAGGVGHFAVQIAKAAGATVFATARAADRDFVRDLGAETVVDHRTDRFDEIATDIDVVLDLVGGEVQDRSWKVLRAGGILVSTVQQPDPAKAAAAGARPGRLHVTEPSGSQLKEIATLIDSGKVKVTIAARYDLDKVGDAQAALEKGGVRGKIVVSIAAADED